jgi:hypothetical protein
VMNTLVPANASPALALGSPQLDRRTRKELERVRTGGMLLAAENLAKVHAIADVGQGALMAASHISATEAMLVSRVPHAEARLRHIADAGAACLANVVLSMSRWTY